MRDNQQQQLEQLMKMLHKNNGHNTWGGSHTGPTHVWNGDQDLIDRWGGLPPVKLKEAEDAVKSVPVHKKRAVIRDLVITNMKVNHAKKYVAVTLHPRSETSKTVSVKIPLNHKALKNLNLNEVYDIFGEMKIFTDGKVQVVAFHKLECL